MKRKTTGQTKMRSHTYPISNWDCWAKEHLTQNEYAVFMAFYEISDIEHVSLHVKLSTKVCLKLLKSSLNKVKRYYKVYNKVASESKVQLFTKKQFLDAPLAELGLSTRLYHILNGEDIYNLRVLLRYRIYGLKRIRGFGEKSLNELMELLDKKGCLDLLE